MRRESSAFRRRSYRRAGGFGIGSAGFTAPELLFAMGAALVITGIALPSITNFTQKYRLTADARSIAAAIHLARMRAASDFSRGELSIDTLTNSYEVKVWSKTSNAYLSEGGSEGGSGTTATYLASGDVFGYGSITAPAGTQTTIAQTTQVIFNSRGYSIDSSGNQTGNSVVYLRNSSGDAAAVSVSLAGEPTVWIFNNGTGAWVQQW